jgi:hypothetical protein
LPVKKAEGEDYRPVQDLWAVNNAVITLHPVVPNHYTLLSLLPPQASWFTCLDLKDTFFCLCLAPVSQPLFAFEWEDPHTGRKMQITWTRSPQGFKNSPTMFGEALVADLSTFPEENPSCTLLQYVYDLLLASRDRERCWERDKGTGSLTLRGRLQSLLEKGPNLPTRGPIPWVHHLRGTVSPGSREEAGCLLHPSAKDQEGGLRIPESGRILPHVDIWIFKPGQTTL